MFYIAIIITNLLGRPLEIIEWPKYEFTTMAACQATLSKSETTQTLARIGAGVAATMGEANFTRGFCYSKEKIDSNGNTVRPS